MTNVSTTPKLATLNQKLAERKAAFTSAQMQIQSINKIAEENKVKIADAEGNSQALDKDTAQKIMILSNMKVQSEPTAPKEPDKVEPPSGERPTVTDSESVAPEVKLVQKNAQKKWDEQQTKYEDYKNNKLPAYEKELKQYEENKLEYAKFLKLKEDIQGNGEQKKISDNDLKTLMNAAQETEGKLKALGEEYDFNYTEYQKLTEEMKQAELEVTLRNKGDETIDGGGNDCVTKNLRDLANKNSIKNLDVSKIDLSKYDLKTETDKDGKTTYTLIDKETHKELEATDLDSLEKSVKGLKGEKTANVGNIFSHVTKDDEDNNRKLNHNKLAEGTTLNYGKASEEMGFDLDTSNDFGAEIDNLLNPKKNVALAAAMSGPVSISTPPEIGKDDLSKIKLNTSETKPDEEAGKKSDVVKARGIPYNDKKTDADWGYKDNGDGTFTSLKDPSRTLTADQLNEAMRKGEDTIHFGYSKLLDKAENYDIDIDKIVTKGMTGDEAYKAVKAAVKAAQAEEKAAKKLNKAEQKYSAEITKYGISVDDYNNADELKALVKQAKKQPQQKTSLQPDVLATQPKADKGSTAVSEITIPGWSTTTSTNISVSALDNSAKDAINGVKNQVGTRQNLYIDGISYTAQSNYDGTVIVKGNDGKTYKLSDDGKTLIPS